MSKAEKAALKSKAAQFVREVVVDIYGQNPSKKLLRETADRVADTIIAAKVEGKEMRAGREEPQAAR
jgi:GTP cyclohydrolase I